jgi:hypothetical protein
MVRNFAAQIAQRQPGPHWLGRWLKANKKDLKCGYLTPIDGARKKAESAYHYSLYFKLLARKIKEYDIQPRNMYNMDEKGFLIDWLAKVRRIFSRIPYESSRVKHVIQDGNREWITFIPKPPRGRGCWQRGGPESFRSPVSMMLVPVIFSST